MPEVASVPEAAPVPEVASVPDAVSLVLFTVAVVKFPEVVSAWTATVGTPPKTKKDSVAIAAQTNFLPSLYIL